LCLGIIGLAAGVAVVVVCGIAPCDPSAPIMSFDSKRLMPQPYRGWYLALHITAPILLGLAAGFAAHRRRVGVGLLTWFLLGLVLLAASEKAYNCT
jgi:hypothetical protein